MWSELSHMEKKQFLMWIGRFVSFPEKRLTTLMIRSNFLSTKTFSYVTNIFCYMYIMVALLLQASTEEEIKYSFLWIFAIWTSHPSDLKQWWLVKEACRTAADQDQASSNSKEEGRSGHKLSSFFSVLSWLPEQPLCSWRPALPWLRSSHLLSQTGIDQALQEIESPWCSHIPWQAWRWGQWWRKAASRPSQWMEIWEGLQFFCHISSRSLQDLKWRLVLLKIPVSSTELLNNTRTNAFLSVVQGIFSFTNSFLHRSMH